MRVRTLAGIGLSLLLAAAASGAVAGEAPARLLVIGPESRFLEPAQIEPLQNSLRSLIERYSGLRRVEPPMPIAELRKKARCFGAQPACLARLGKLAGAERVLHCEVQKLPGKYLVDVTLVEVSSGRMLSQIRGRSEPAAEALLAALLKGWVDALGPLPLSQIKVYANVTGADVFLDGQKLGQTPLILTRDPGPGAHTIEISAAGYEPFSQPIRVEPGGDIRVEAVLKALAPKAEVAEAGTPVAGSKLGRGKDEDEGAGESPPPPAEPLKPRATRPGWLRLADETAPAGAAAGGGIAAAGAAGAAGGGREKTPGDTENHRRLKERPFFRTWWFWTAVGAVVGGAAAALAVGLSGGGSDIPDGKGRLVLTF